jgi:phenylalanyl-tRNA synthetase beta chain
MNLSLNWLNDYVSTESIPLTELISGLTMSGSKVEKYKDTAEALSKIVIGKVVQIKKHEDSEKLWICQIDTGGVAESGGAEVQIVTAAQNVTEGAIVPVVSDGGTVLRDGEAFKIKKGKLRGEVSEGMLCSPDELGLDKSELPYADEDGILLLNKDPQADKLVIGGCAVEFLGLRDTAVEFEITNNRPDCFSVTGLARETSATFDLPLNIPEPVFKGVDGDINSEIKVRIEDKRCSRYMAGLVKDVTIAPSPRWMQSRLKTQGVRPINNIVDITNYVMLEYGNPLHAFDRRFIEDGQIVVRAANDGEQITLLDGNTVTLNPDVLVIADSVKPVAVAGVMGGEHSGVVDDTCTVVFEAACFDPVSVRRTAKKIGRRTESSARFEKGLSPVNAELALVRALQLVEELGIGTVVNTLIDCGDFSAEEAVIELNADKINARLGTELSEGEQIAILNKLGFVNEGSRITVPWYRSDIESWYDLSEEVARIYGYNRIESTLPRLTQGTASNKRERELGKLVNVLVAQGCRECITYSFVSPEMADDSAVRLRNPFGEETSVMRTSMIPSMLKVIADNINTGNSEARLFETGRVYSGGKEPDMLCIGFYGRNEDFYSFKDVFEEILASFKLETSVSRYTQAPFHPGRAACCEYAKLGEVNPLVLSEYGIEEKVYVAEIDLDKLFAGVKGKTVYKSIPKYPASQRDLSLVCDNDTASGEVESIIGKSCRNYLESVEYFDVFDLRNGQKSLSYKLTFRKSDGTLTDEEVDKSIKQILSKLEQNNITLRS